MHESPGRQSNKIKEIFLIAIGISEDGNRENLGFAVADGESEEAWGDFFSSLKA